MIVINITIETYKVHIRGKVFGTIRKYIILCNQAMFDPMMEMDSITSVIDVCLIKDQF